MDIFSLVSTLWGKVSKPIPNMLIGLVILKFAPDEHKWLGYIFVAIGASSIIETGINYTKTLMDDCTVSKKIHDSLRCLNREESQLIRKLVCENHQTFSTQNSSYYALSQGGDGGRTGRQELLDTCSGLQDKGLLSPGLSFPYTCVTVPNNVWKIINKLYKDNPKIFDLVIYTGGNNRVTILSSD